MIRTEDSHPFPAVVGVDAHGTVGATGSLVNAHQNAAALITDHAAKDLAAIAADHLVGGHPKEALRCLVDPGNHHIPVVED
ncbi:MAG: hypothetical protein NTY38_01390 [Acidobacteria bacterium]|nr:hypothetical protein [Acidobacteriota bacterium]